MKMVKFLLIALIIGFSAQINAQSADEILANYFENIGGLDKLQQLEGMKMSAKVNQGGMEIPLEMVQLKNGKQMTVINFQGKEIKQGVFNGEVLWSTNFMTQKAEKGDQETTDNMKLQMKDFPDPFLNYKEKGYLVELLGKESIDGADAFKIKLTKSPITVDGVKEDDISYYYFDAENFIPLVVHSEIKTGPMKGQVSETKMSDYLEVDGLFFPHSLTQGLKGQPGQAIAIDKIELNPQVDDKEFEFPEEEATEADPEKK